MTIAQRIGQVAASIETSTKRAELFYLLRHLLAARGSVVTARNAIEGDRLASQRVREVVKEAVTLQSLIEPLDGNSWIISAFNESLRSASAFDAMLGDNAFRVVPLDTRVGIVATGATGAPVPEGHVKLATTLSLANEKLTPKKVSSILAVSQEIVRSSAPSTAGMLGRELTAALGVATDSAFFAGIIAGGITSSGTAGATALNSLTDLGTLLTAVAPKSASRLYFATTPAVAAKLAVRADTAGVRAFPEATPTGGQLIGVPLLVSDGVPSGTLLLIDASRIAANTEAVVLDISEQVLLQMDTTPDSPPSASSALVSTWQNDLVAMKADRWFGYELLSTAAAAAITGM